MRLSKHTTGREETSSLPLPQRRIAMKHYIIDKNGKQHTIEEYGWSNETNRATICIDNFSVKKLKMYYRHERTWDDHMGNTPCGYYVNVPLTSRDIFGRKCTERRRVYLNLAM